jgi:hypothetical protein
VPVRAGAAGAALAVDVHALVVEVTRGVHDLAAALHLEGELVDSVLGAVVLRAGGGGEELLVGGGLFEDDEGVVVAAVAGEEAAAEARVGAAEAEQVEVEARHWLDIHDVQAEVAEAANLERAVEQDAAHVVLGRGLRGHAVPPRHPAVTRQWV